MNPSPKDKMNAVEVLAQKVLDTSYRSLLLQMRFIDIALGFLTPKAHEDALSTDGTFLYYNPKEIVQSYRKSANLVTHNILHSLFHCIFHHITPMSIEALYWDLACDICVEELIASLNKPYLTLVTPEKIKAISYFKENVKPFTPKKVIDFLKVNHSTPKELSSLQTIFTVDDHDLWYKKKSPAGQNSDGSGAPFLSLSSQQPPDWVKISRSVLMNLESFYQKQGSSAGNMEQQLKAVTREPYDYSRFLRKFAQQEEVQKVNDDEFDQIFYTYGLEMYGNMPLIEPLEYKDDTRIRDFVIAIDTSGSTSGEVVQCFLQKTYNILKNTDSFSKNLNLFIIQCDAFIQEVVHVTSDFYFEEYIQNMTIKGHGGTDFRPVFGYMNKLMEEKVFSNLKGLLYFTDGYGKFPSQKTSYETAFVFVVKEDYDDVTVPPWAIKVLLTEDEIIESKGT